MSGSPTRRRRDLIGTVALVLGALLVSVLPIPDWAAMAVLLPAVLIAPGYAISAALFRPGEITREFRIVLSFALSVSTFALGGLLVQIVLPLDRLLFACLLAAVTIGAGLIAFRRRQDAPINTTDPRPGLSRINPVAAMIFLAAVALAAWGIETASRGANDQLKQTHFTSLWMLPERSDRSAGTVRIGVANHEGRRFAYRLQVRQGSDIVRRWHIELEADQKWQKTLAAPSDADDELIGTLYRDGALYRRVVLEIGGQS